MTEENNVSFLLWIENRIQGMPRQCQYATMGPQNPRKLEDVLADLRSKIPLISPLLYGATESNDLLRAHA